MTHLNVDGTADRRATVIDGTLNVKSDVDFDTNLNVDGTISVTATPNFDGEIFIEAAEQPHCASSPRSRML